MEEVPSSKGKEAPPMLHVKKLKDYTEKDYDTPCVVIEDASCETMLQHVKDGIIGINRAGILSILNGAVPPTQSWVRYVYRQIEQPKNYVDMYPKQSWLLAEINDMLLRHAMSTRMKSVLTLKVGAPIDYAKIKLDLETQFGLTAEHFSDSLGLPTIRPMTPSFYTDPMMKYVWAMKVWQGKLNLKEEAFEYMLEVLDTEETETETETSKRETVQYVTEVYDYSIFETGARP